MEIVALSCHVMVIPAICLTVLREWTLRFIRQGSFHVRFRQISLAGMTQDDMEGELRNENIENEDVGIGE